MDVNTKFGDSVYKEHLYSVWNSMKQRCYNTNDKAFANYGGRGITVCSEWLNDYRAFKAWALKNGYAPGLWIDRIENNGPYEPKNCRWATPRQQQRNKRTNIVLTIGDVSKCVSEWVDESGIPYATLKRRIELGWPAEKILLPVDKRYSHGEKIKKAFFEKGAIYG